MLDHLPSELKVLHLLFRGFSLCDALVERQRTDREILVLDQKTSVHADTGHLLGDISLHIDFQNPEILFRAKQFQRVGSK